MLRRMQGSPLVAGLRDDLTHASLAARMSIAAARAPPGRRSTAAGMRGASQRHTDYRNSTWSSASRLHPGQASLGLGALRPAEQNAPLAAAHADEAGGGTAGVANARDSTDLGSMGVNVASSPLRRQSSRLRSGRFSVYNPHGDHTYEEMLQARLTETQEKLQQRLTHARTHSMMGGQMAMLHGEEDVELSMRLSWVSFVDGEIFKMVVAAILLLNMWALALESDFPEWPWWDLLNSLFLLVFIIEFGFRLLRWGPKQLLWFGKQHRWMAYDLFVIGIGVLDVIVSCLYDAPPGVSEMALAGVPGDLGVPSRSTEDSGGDLVRVLAKRRLFEAPLSTGQFGIVRFLMLSRLLRIGRVLKIINPLYDCVNLLMDMMNTFIWILSLIFVFCFVLAIILTRLLGHGLAVKTQDAELRAKVQSMFEDIPTSLFTLFQLTTAEDWSLIAYPVVQVFGIWRYFFVVFITFMSWTMLSLLTAVASETMIAFSSYKKEEEKIYQEIQRHSFTTFLCKEFLAVDTDGNHVLDKQEFTELMSRPSMMEEMKSHGINLADQDLVRTWDTFDIDDSGELSIDELVTGFAYLQESLAMKHVANVGYGLKRFTMRIDSDMGEMEADIERSADVKQALLERTMDRAARSRERWSLFFVDSKTEGRAESPSGPTRKSTKDVSSPAGGGSGQRRLLDTVSWTWNRGASATRNTTV